jgi:hypothetical protein
LFVDNFKHRIFAQVLGLFWGRRRLGKLAHGIKIPVPIEDLHATILRTTGIPADLAYEVEERPFYATRDGKGKCIEWAQGPETLNAAARRVAEDETPPERLLSTASFRG